ncbi:hypothetical protein CHUAL_008529 [Chamberlinius hualienensis]
MSMASSRSTATSCICTRQVPLFVSLVRFIIFIFLILSGTYSRCEAADEDVYARQKPTVLLVLLARNKAHTLPYVLTQIQNLDYPKSRISLWVRSDHNVDKTVEVLQTWINDVQYLYHSVNFDYHKSPPFYHADENGLYQWSENRFWHMIKLKEEAKETAIRMWADFIWYVDCDVLFTNNQTLNILMAQQKILIAPMLETLGAYSNYWCGMTEKYYYQRTADYMPILERKKKGCFVVPMIHSCVLWDLRALKSQLLTFDPDKMDAYTGPVDDIITFAISAKLSNVTMHVLNTEAFGFLLYPLESENHLTDDYDQLSSLKLEVIVENPPLSVKPFLSKFIKTTVKDKLGFNEVYLINLLRRSERREKMLSMFNELGVDVKLLDAVDGRNLNASYLDRLGVHMLPEYLDPYHKRPLTMGEIGCFLSHYNIWKDVVENGHQMVLVFEDDIKFEPYFRKKLATLLFEVDKLQVDWDLIYLGRKRLLEKQEPLVPGSKSIVSVEYSYWTLCYMISLQGARKLLMADPLSKMVPVDEYLPIMFDKHPEVAWKGYFTNRNLKAYSAAPLLVYPTHYTGDKDYISDTEDSIGLSLQSKDEL